MRKAMRWISRALAFAITGGLLLSWTPTASAQTRRRETVIFFEPVPVYDPFFDPFFPYPYGYAPGYVAAHYGYVKIDTHRKDENVALYIDGGYAARIRKKKKLALRPGNHEIQLRDSDGRTIFRERVAVLVGETTKVDVPS